MKGLRSALSMRFLEVSTSFSLPPTPPPPSCVLGTIYDCSVCMLDRKTYGQFGLRGEKEEVEGSRVELNENKLILNLLLY